MEHIWEWFLDLSLARPVGYGPTPISFSEIEAYSRLMGVEITPWEVEQLRRIDRLAVVEASKKRKQTKTAPDGRTFKEAGNLDAMKSISAFAGATAVKRPPAPTRKETGNG